MPLTSEQEKKIFDKFEAELSRICITPSKILSEDLSSVLLSTGKRIRPRLALLCASLGRVDPKQIIPVMVILELAHNASLMHDDVIDNASIRHGVPTINAIRNDKLAILAGNYLLGMIEKYSEQHLKFTVADSIRRNMKRNNPSATFNMHSINHLICDMSLGEYMQYEVAFSIEQQNLEHYFNRIKLKTGLLMRYCCISGGSTGHLSRKQVQFLSDMGLSFGMAFQIADDILDYDGNLSIGKTVGQDFMCGLCNLPMICALERNKNDEIIRLFEKREKSQAEIDRLVKFVIENGGIEDAVKYRDEYTEKALTELERFKEDENRNNLAKFISSIATRTF